LLFDEAGWSVELSTSDGFRRSHSHPTAIEALNEVVPAERAGRWMAELARHATERQIAPR
jgi:hypothetical protein